MKNIHLIILALTMGFSSFSQETNLSFDNEGLQLNGTLALPNTNSPAPLVILIHGSGPSDRDQTIQLTDGNSLCLYPELYNLTIKSFENLSDGLVEKGYAVFRYDKRTYTHANTLDAFTISPYDFISDVNSAIDFMKTNSEIDSNNIILLGHSQGANFLPIISQERNDIKALLSLGTTATSIDSLMATQFRELYYRCLHDTISGNNFYNQTLANFEQIRNDNWPNNTPYLGAYSPFWNDWIDITESSLTNYNLIETPTLFLHAQNDFNIPTENAIIYQNGLINSNHQLYYMDGLTHFFTPENSNEVPQIVIDTIHDWLATILDTPFSINDVVKKEFQVIYYDGQIKINNNNHHTYSIDVINMQSQIIHSDKITKDDSYYINTSRINPGIYIIKLNTKLKEETHKLNIW